MARQVSKLFFIINNDMARTVRGYTDRTCAFSWPDNESKEQSVAKSEE
jgi:hypothetical protein